VADDDDKKYRESLRLGIKGEAFFESLVGDHAIPHRIARQNHLGLVAISCTNVSRACAVKLTTLPCCRSSRHTRCACVHASGCASIHSRMT
jgi:hypothetical protein